MLIMVLEIDFGLLYGGEDSKHDGAGFVEIAMISAVHGNVFLQTVSFDMMYSKTCVKSPALK